MSFYQNLQKTAAKLLQSKGQKLKFERTVKGDYNAAEGERDDDSTVSFSAYGAVFDYKAHQVDDRNVISGDRRLLVEYTKKQILSNDRVEIDGIWYLVVEPKPLQPAGINVITECQVRAGGNVRNV